MDDWMKSYARALAGRLGRGRDAIGIPGDAMATILSLARVVAHGTERINAPLASYLAGRYAALRAEDGVGAEAALEEAAEVAASLLPGEVSGEGPPAG